MSFINIKKIKVGVEFIIICIQTVLQFKVSIIYNYLFKKNKSIEKYFIISINYIPVKKQ